MADAQHAGARPFRARGLHGPGALSAARGRARRARLRRRAAGRDSARQLHARPRRLAAGRLNGTGLRRACTRSARDRAARDGGVEAFRPCPVPGTSRGPRCRGRSATSTSFARRSRGAGHVPCLAPVVAGRDTATQAEPDPSFDTADSQLGLGGGLAVPEAQEALAGRDAKPRQARGRAQRGAAGRASERGAARARRDADAPRHGPLVRLAQAPPLAAPGRPGRAPERDDEPPVRGAAPRLRPEVPDRPAAAVEPREELHAPV